MLRWFYMRHGWQDTGLGDTPHFYLFQSIFTPIFSGFKLVSGVPFSRNLKEGGNIFKYFGLGKYIQIFWIWKICCLAKKDTFHIFYHSKVVNHGNFKNILIL